MDDDIFERGNGISNDLSDSAATQARSISTPNMESHQQIGEALQQEYLDASFEPGSITARRAIDDIHNQGAVVTGSREDETINYHTEQGALQDCFDYELAHNPSNFSFHYDEAHDPSTFSFDYEHAHIPSYDATDNIFNTTAHL
ncbi:hypothetical protein EAF04_010114 [Stromatinia cepivora]|nr:hypothetical protein EAF04_010114 [Stromatinia cepivora]